MELILASNSPRRKEMLKKFGFDFTVIPSDFVETVSTDDPVKCAKSFAYGKAKDVYENLPDKKDKVVLGADTVVYFNGKILGKPKDEKDAIKTLKELSGKVHTVITGYAIVGENVDICTHVLTEVVFNSLSDEEISEYIKSGLYKGKAGSYGIQDGYNLVKSYNGSLNNVIGLPIEVFGEELKSILCIK